MKITINNRNIVNLNRINPQIETTTVGSCKIVLHDPFNTYMNGICTTHGLFHNPTDSNQLAHNLRSIILSYYKQWNK